MEKVNRIEKAKEITRVISDKWKKLQDDFYMCYSVKELAYKVASEILKEWYGDNTDEICETIYCRQFENEWKIAIYFEQDIYLIFDIWWATGMFGDTGLHIGNATINGFLPKGYEDIEYVLEENEE